MQKYILTISGILLLAVSIIYASPMRCFFCPSGSLGVVIQVNTQDDVAKIPNDILEKCLLLIPTDSALYEHRDTLQIFGDNNTCLVAPLQTTTSKEVLHNHISTNTDVEEIKDLLHQGDELHKFYYIPYNAELLSSQKHLAELIKWGEVNDVTFVTDSEPWNSSVIHIDMALEEESNTQTFQNNITKVDKLLDHQKVVIMYRMGGVRDDTFINWLRQKNLHTWN